MTWIDSTLESLCRVCFISSVLYFCNIRSHLAYFPDNLTILLIFRSRNTSARHTSTSSSSSRSSLLVISLQLLFHLPNPTFTRHMLTIDMCRVCMERGLPFRRFGLREQLSALDLELLTHAFGHNLAVLGSGFGAARDGAVEDLFESANAPL